MSRSDPRQHVHFMGIGGSGMSSLAGLFVRAGWKVSGCDKAIVYPPASKTLSDMGIDPLVGFSRDHLDTPTDLVIVGNIVRKDNDEDIAARERKIPRLHMAAALYSYFIKNKVSVVVSGTHGKTTCSSLLSFLLNTMGLDPGFFLGGVCRDLGTSYHNGRGEFFVTEGDEYDCAWFDKHPKFLHYHPKDLLITNVEFDHADIYGSIDDVTREFTKLVTLVPPDGCIVYCMDSPNLPPIMTHASCRIQSYSATRSDADWRFEPKNDPGTSSSYALIHGGMAAGGFNTRLPGQHNALNITGVVALIHSMGLDIHAALANISNFSGAERRMQEKTTGQVILIDDFAHHPTEIAATVSAVRHRWPNRTVWALYEPKTQTGRRAVFQDETAGALGMADGILILEPKDLDGIPPETRIDVGHLCEMIRAEGDICRSFTTGDSLARFLFSRLDDSDTVIVMMSAGSFQGLCSLLERVICEKGLGSRIESGGYPFR